MLKRQTTTEVVGEKVKIVTCLDSLRAAKRRSAKIITNLVDSYKTVFRPERLVKTFKKWRSGCIGIGGNRVAERGVYRMLLYLSQCHV